MPLLSALRYHWFDVGCVLALVLALSLVFIKPEGVELLMWLSLGSLFLHQAEEWRYPGYFPGMVNVVMFKSDRPDRYPLNANSGMIINVCLGWGSYLLAALFWRQMMWLAIATILVSLGNIIAHTIIFNVKGKTIYNPGLITCWLCFAPVIYVFISMTSRDNLIQGSDWAIGILLGLALNYFGVYKMILWLSDRNTVFAFPTRCLLKHKNS